MPALQPGAPQPTCLVAASERSKADQLAAATGFAAWPLLLGHPGEAGRLNGSVNGRCCLEQAAAAAAAANAQPSPTCAAAQAPATAVPPARPLPGADVFCFAGSLHLVNTHAALQVGRNAECAVVWHSRVEQSWGGRLRLQQVVLTLECVVVWHSSRVE